jgi:hypothetical protein
MELWIKPVTREPRNIDLNKDGVVMSTDNVFILIFNMLISRLK